jgi:hypothetical protein
MVDPAQANDSLHLSSRDATIRIRPFQKKAIVQEVTTHYLLVLSLWDVFKNEDQVVYENSACFMDAIVVPSRLRLIRQN